MIRPKQAGIESKERVTILPLENSAVDKRPDAVAIPRLRLAAIRSVETEVERIICKPCTLKNQWIHANLMRENISGSI